MNMTFGPLLLAAMLPAAPALKEASGDDQGMIQGEWRMESCAYGATRVPADILTGAVINFRESRLNGSTPEIIIRGGGQAIFQLGLGSDFQFKLDSTARPKRIDLKLDTKDGLTMYSGIYRFDGDRLEICYVRGDVRPTEFRAGEKHGRVFWELRRPRK